MLVLGLFCLFLLSFQKRPVVNLTKIHEALLKVVMLLEHPFDFLVLKFCFLLLLATLVKKGAVLLPQIVDTPPHLFNAFFLPLDHFLKVVGLKPERPEILFVLGFVVLADADENVKALFLQQ